MKKLFSWKSKTTIVGGVAFAIFFSSNLDYIVADQGTRAPRDGSTDFACACANDSGELNLIRGCICQINTNVGGLTTCCESLTSIVERDFAETWTAIDACCNGNGVDFSETWTILGNNESDVAVGGIDTLDEINTSTLSIVAWLKTIYAQSRGLIT